MFTMSSDLLHLCFNVLKKPIGKSVWTPSFFKLLRRDVSFGHSTITKFCSEVNFCSQFGSSANSEQSSIINVCRESLAPRTHHGSTVALGSLLMISVCRLNWIVSSSSPQISKLSSSQSLISKCVKETRSFVQFSGKAARLGHFSITKIFKVSAAPLNHGGKAVVWGSPAISNFRRLNSTTSLDPIAKLIFSQSNIPRVSNLVQHMMSRGKDLKFLQSLIVKNRSDLRRPTPFSGRFACDVVTISVLRLTNFLTSFGNSSSFSHSSRTRVCRFCNLKTESGSFLIFLFPLRLRYRKCLRLPNELGNTLKDKSVLSKSCRYLN